MSDSLLSVGIDLGTSTTQMILSRLWVFNEASAFAVPKMAIQKREILYRSPIHFTPLLDSRTLDAEAIRKILTDEYHKAGIQPDMIQTGAVIITGETARKENAKAVLEALANLAGEFVVATAGPQLESVLAARGAGADRIAQQNNTWVLHMDIGGGTSNLALFDPKGNLADTGCLNVGGRLLKVDENRKVTYVSPVLQPLHPPQVGQTVTAQQLVELAEALTRALEQVAGLQPKSELFSHFITDKTVKLPEEPVALSFSGGVADLIKNRSEDLFAYGDLGVFLGQAIGNSQLCRGTYFLGHETIRATVVGAGSYATELSGSTVYYTHVTFPIHDLPVVCAEPWDKDRLHRELSVYDGQPVALSMAGMTRPTFSGINTLAKEICELIPAGPVAVALEADHAKALGQAIRMIRGEQTPIVCLDGIHVPKGSYLDLGAPVGGGAAVPVVVKTLAFL